MGSELAQRKPGASRDFQGWQLLFQYLQHRQSVGIERRLAAGGAGKLVDGPFEHGLRQLESELFISPFEKGFSLRIGSGQVLAHADFLGTLAREQQHYFSAHFNFLVECEPSL